MEKSMFGVLIQRSWSSLYAKHRRRATRNNDSLDQRSQSSFCRCVLVEGLRRIIVDLHRIVQRHEDRCQWINFSFFDIEPRRTWNSVSLFDRHWSFSGDSLRRSVVVQWSRTDLLLVIVWRTKRHGYVLRTCESRRIRSGDVYRHVESAFNHRWHQWRSEGVEYRTLLLFIGLAGAIRIVSSDSCTFMASTSISDHLLWMDRLQRLRRFSSHRSDRSHRTSLDDQWRRDWHLWTTTTLGYRCDVHRSIAQRRWTETRNLSPPEWQRSQWFDSITLVHRSILSFLLV